MTESVDEHLESFDEACLPKPLSSLCKAIAALHWPCWWYIDNPKGEIVFTSDILPHDVVVIYSSMYGGNMMITLTSRPKEK